jgi:ribosomal protein S12 methylthiotransferase accessory factor
MQLTAHEASPVSETLIKGKRLVSAQTGIVRYLYEFPCDPDTPQIFGYGAITTDSTAYGFKTSGTVSGSTSIIRERAIAGALGEAIERYSAAVIPEEELLFASFNDLNESAIDPRRLALYSDQQYGQQGFPYQRFEPHHRIRWIEGFSLSRRKEVWVPAFATYIPYKRAAGEPCFVQQITTGLACGNTLEEAISSGISEVAERDATMMAWLGKRSLPRLLLDFPGKSLAQQTLERFGPLQKDVILLDASTDAGIQAVIALLLSDEIGPDAVFASKASLNPEQAVTGALDELAQCIVWVRSLTRSELGFRSPPLDAVESMEDHVLWPAFRQNRSHHQLLWDSEETRNCSSLPNNADADVKRSIETAVRLLDQIGLEVIVVDVTAPDIRAAGFHVVRVIIPEAQPLYFGSNLYRISHRLRERLQATSPADLTNGRQPFPHPFP